MKDLITYPDFEKIDLRAGKILTAIAPEWSEKLLEFTVDFGEEIGQRTILSGIKQWYQPETFVGKLYPFVVNMAPRKMGPSQSEGMMIMADAEDKPTVFELPESIVPGTVIR